MIDVVFFFYLPSSPPTAVLQTSYIKSKDPKSWNPTAQIVQWTPQPCLPACIPLTYPPPLSLSLQTLCQAAKDFLLTKAFDPLQRKFLIAVYISSIIVLGNFREHM